MRGLALVIMIQVHVFNSFARMDARNSGVYAMAVFVGGMAGPLFLFMAGMTFAFQMDRLETRSLAPFIAGWPACGAPPTSGGSPTSSASPIGPAAGRMPDGTKSCGSTS